MFIVVSHQYRSTIFMHQYVIIVMGYFVYSCLSRLWIIEIYTRMFAYNYSTMSFDFVPLFLKPVLVQETTQTFLYCK